MDARHGGAVMTWPVKILALLGVWTLLSMLVGTLWAWLYPGLGWEDETTYEHMRRVARGDD